MQSSPVPYASRSSSNPLLHGRPYTPPPGRACLEGASSSITTTSSSSSSSQADGKAVTVRAEIPRSLSQAMVDIVTVDSPGVTPTPLDLFLDTPVPVHEEEDEQEPGAADLRAGFARLLSDNQEQPGSVVTWHGRQLPSPVVADLPDRKDHKAEAPAPEGEVVVADPAVPQPLPQPQALHPLEVLAPGVVAGEVVPRQGLCDKMAIAVRVGAGNVTREFVAGGLRVATHLAVARAVVRGAYDGKAGSALAGVGTSVGAFTGGLLAAQTLRRLAAAPYVSPGKFWAGMALASGLVPLFATSVTTSSAAGLVLHSNFLGRLAGALVTEAVMQLTDGVTARARLVAPPVDPLEPDVPPSLWSTLRGRPIASPTAYIGLGAVAELLAGPSIARALEGLGLSAEAAKAAVSAVPELCFALWDSIAMAAAACSDDLDLALEPGQLSALAGNLRRFGETLARIGQLSGARVLANSPLDFVGIGAAMHPGSRGMEVVDMFVRHLSRIRGSLQQEARTPAGTLDGAAQDFLAAHDAFLGSSGAGLDIRRRAGAFGEPDDLV